MQTFILRFETVWIYNFYSSRLGPGKESHRHCFAANTTKQRKGTPGSGFAVLAMQALLLSELC